ncbi:MAG: c-type cytochrome, partial [Gammaproteobacteria bacterium]|nr:c-type cytochrome [Gammaproteobacteria bacterium]
NLDEIKAAISYLQSQGGEVDLEAINNPSEIASAYYERIEAASAAGGGDPGAGEEMFVDNCSDCHLLNGEGGEVGPDLSTIADKGLKFISESILVPAKKITEGYETYIVVDKEGLKTVGIKTRDTATEVDITTDVGEVVTIARSDIEEITEDEDNSVMPNDLTEALTVKDFQDIQAFLMLQKGEQEEQ